MKYTVSGNFRVAEKMKHFDREIEASSDDDARERIFALFGSEHGTKRRWIEIKKVSKAE